MMTTPCAYHPNTIAKETCTSCRKPVCDECWLSLRGVVVCRACAVQKNKTSLVWISAAALIGATGAAFYAMRPAETKAPQAPQKTYEAKLSGSLFGATAGVRALALSSDQKWLASAGDDGTVRLWSTLDGKAQKILRGAQKRLRAVTFVGERIIAAGDDKRVYIWDGQQEAPVASLEQHTAPISALFALSDNRHAVSLGQDGQLLLWEVSQARLARVASSTELGLIAGAISAQKDRIAVAERFQGGFAVIRVFETVGFTQLFEVKTLEAINALAFSPDGTKLAYSAYSGVKTGVYEVDLVSQTPTQISTLRDATALLYSASGPLLASTQSGEIVEITPAATTPKLTDETRQPLWTLLEKDGQLFFAGEASVIGVASQKEGALSAKPLVPTAHIGSATDLVSLADGQLVVTGPSGAARFSLQKEGAALVRRYATGDAKAVSSSRDGSFLAFVGDCSQGCRADLLRGLLPAEAKKAIDLLQTASIKAQERPDPSCFFVRSSTSDLEKLASALEDLSLPWLGHSDEGGIFTTSIFAANEEQVPETKKRLTEALKNPETNVYAELLPEKCATLQVLGADASRAEALLAQANIGGSRAKTSGAAVFSKNEPAGLLLETQGGSVTDVAFSPRELLVAVSSSSGELLFFEPGSATPLGALDGPPSALSRLAFSPDGKLLAAGYSSGEIVLWDVKTRQKVRSLFAVEGASPEPSSLTFSPDGASLLLSNRGTGLILFDVASGDRRVTYSGFFSPLQASTFSLDGALVVGATSDGEVKVFTAESGALLTSFKAGDTISSLAFGQDGRLYLAGYTKASDSAVTIWTLQTNE